MDMNFSPREKILAAAAICLALLVLWNQFMLQPLLAQVSAVNDRIEARTVVMEQRQEWERRDSETRAAISRLEGERATLLEEVNTVSSVQDLLGFLSTASTARNVVLNNVNLHDDKGFTVSCSVFGYENAREFVRSLEIAPNMRIESISMSSNGNHFSMTIKAELGLGKRPPAPGLKYPRSVPFN